MIEENLSKVLFYFSNEVKFNATKKQSDINKLDLYYQSGFSDRIKENYWIFDDKGIPKAHSPNLSYNPTGISGYGYGLLELYDMTKERKYLIEFKKIADWLVNNQEKETIDNMQCGLWYYYDTNPPWISAMAQGQCISILTRAYKLFQDDKYINACNIGINPFYIHEKDGGVYSIDQGYIFLEEYPNKSSKHVLNGFIYAILGIWDYYNVSSDKKAHNLFENCIHTLENNIDKYDLGYWTLYNLPKDNKNIASRWYHQIHISMMEIIYNITRKQVFNYYMNKWLKYDNSFLCRMKALKTKSFSKF